MLNTEHEILGEKDFFYTKSLGFSNEKHIDIEWWFFFVRLKFKCHNMWYYLHFETNDSCKACKYIQLSQIQN